MTKYIAPVTPTKDDLILQLYDIVQEQQILIAELIADLPESGAKEQMRTVVARTASKVEGMRQFTEFALKGLKFALKGAKERND